MFFSSLGLLISLILIFSILGILRPVKKFLVDQFERNLPVDIVIVKARTETAKTSSLLGLLKKNQDHQLGISERFLKEVIKWKEVESVNVTQILQKPVMGQFDHPVLSKMEISFNMLIQGVDYSLISNNLKCMKNFKPLVDINDEGEKITLVPLLLPESFADMAYAYTVMNGLPPVTRKEMAGLRILLNVGYPVSQKKTDELQTTKYTGIVCGFVSSNIVSVAGAPLEWVKQIHSNSNQKKAAASYDKLYIKVHNMGMMDSLLNKLSQYPVNIVSGDKNSGSKISKWLGNLDILLWTFVAILLLISSISLSNSFMILTAQKKFEFGLYLVFGASPLFLWFLIFLEGAFWGAFHSSIAFFIAQNFSDILQKFLAIMPWFNEIQNKSVVFEFYITFTEKWYLIFGSILFSGLSSVLPAMYMTGRKTLSLIKKD
jgi:ABC-type antimicrobial peptide transport system permease subunit